MNDPKGRIFRPPASVAPRPAGSASELWLCLGRNISGEYDVPDYIHVLSPICSSSQYKTFRTALTNLLDASAKDGEWYSIVDFLTLSAYPRRCERKLSNELTRLLSEHNIPMRVAVHQDHTWGRSVTKMGADLKSIDHVGQVLAVDWFGEGAPFWPPVGFSLIASLPQAVQWPPSKYPAPPAQPTPSRAPPPVSAPAPPAPQYLSPPQNRAPSHSSSSVGRSSAYYDPPPKAPQWYASPNPPMSPGYGYGYGYSAPQSYYSPQFTTPVYQNGGYNNITLY